MYNEFEKRIKEASILNVFDNIFKYKILPAIIIIYIAYYILFNTNLKNAIGLFLFTILITAFIICYDINKKIKEYSKKNSVIKKIKERKNTYQKIVFLIKSYIINENKKTKNKIIEILKDVGIKNKESLKLLIDYYSNFKPKNNFKNISIISIDSFIIILPMISSLVDYNFNINLPAIEISFIIVLIIVGITSFFRTLKSLFSLDTDFYSNLLLTLNDIYINFDIYKKKLNKS